MGCHYWQRTCWHLGTISSQIGNPAHPRIVVVHRRCAVHRICSSHSWSHHGEPRQSCVPSVSRLLWFRGHHRYRHYLFVSRTTEKPCVPVVRLRWFIHYGSWHSCHARRPSRLIHKILLRVKQRYFASFSTAVTSAPNLSSGTLAL